MRKTCPSEAADPQSGQAGEAPAEPGPDPAVGTPEIDLEGCGLDALELLLDTNGSELAHFAEGWPRRIPPKAHRSVERLTWALLERWAWADCQLYVVERIAATDIRVALARRGLAVRPEVAGFFPPNALLWWVHAAGLEPQQGRRMCEQNDRPGLHLTPVAG